MTPYALSDLKSLLQAAQNSSGGTSESLEPRPSVSAHYKIGIYNMFLPWVHGYKAKGS